MVLEKKIFEGFLPYLGMAAILNFGSKPFYLFFVPLVPGCYIRNLVTFGSVVAEEKSFESVDGRRTEASHILSSPGAFGSGEFKINNK